MKIYTDFGNRYVDTVNKTNRMPKPTPPKPKSESPEEKKHGKTEQSNIN